MPRWVIPYRTPAVFRLIYPSLIWRMPSTEKKLYITFDDGPVPGPTEFALDTLAQYQAMATFFCIGDNIRKHPDIFKKVRDAGHAIGNHTYNHLNGWHTTLPEYMENVSVCQDEIAKHTGAGSKLFRPPYGKIRRSQIKALRHVQIVMWDVITMDFDATIHAEESLEKAIRATRPGSIIIFHDSYKAERKMNFILPRFLDHFSKAGYRFNSLAV